MRWYGWGDEEHAAEMPPHVDAALRSELRLDGGPPRPPVALADVQLPASALGAEARAALEAVAEVRKDRHSRVRHAAGRSYPDLVRLRAGDASSAPDAVVAPRGADGVADVLRVCAEHGVAVVPFGGGTSVVGGVEPLRGSFGAVIALDLRSLDAVTGIDERSLTIGVEPGILLPELERRLEEHGLTLGHFPQSFEYATAGGVVATRSAGQASTGYGRIDELVVGVRLTAPAGELDLAPIPASAAGPDLRELVVGSEGALGVITHASLRVRPRPAEKRYEGFGFASFPEGAEAFRAMEQLHAAPDIARLSDEEETRLSLVFAGATGIKGAVTNAFLRSRGVIGGCLAICGWEGEPDDVARRRARSVALLKKHGARPLGAAPGRAWARARFHTPYLRDEMLARGVFVETLETATQWSRIPGLYAAVRTALHRSLAARGTPPLVSCHISHLYPSGASLYFTWLARQERGAELEQWAAAKEAATDAILANGGTITHHHAVGRDHARWLPAEAGALGIAALRAVKAELDPAGIMNPGKLLEL